MVTCPKCGSVGQNPVSCEKCGINFSGYQHYLDHHSAFRPTQSEFQLEALNRETQIIVQQKEDALRVVTGMQTRNHYVLLDSQSQVFAYLEERGSGLMSILSRIGFRSRRSLTIDISNLGQVPVAEISRPFYWFFSRLNVLDVHGVALGGVQKRFSFFRPTYDLLDSDGQCFARLRSSFFGGKDLKNILLGNRNFLVLDAHGLDLGASVTRVWNGLLNRTFTDEDTFSVEFPPEWSAQQKLILLSAAISIDFDSYESSGKSSIGLIESIWSMGRNDGSN